MFYADMHCDTITKLADKGGSLLQNDLQVDLRKLQTFDAPLQFFALWLNPKYYGIARQKLIEYTDFCLDQIHTYRDLVGLVLTPEDIDRNRKNGKISALISVEGAEGLAGAPEMIEWLYQKGIREISFTWNNDNEFACGANTAGDSGLSPKGFELLERICALNMLVDVSHASDKTFWDIAGACKGPFIASHSNARAVRAHQRNLTDEQLKVLADHGGVVGINLFSDFLSEKERGEVSDILRHIDHIINAAGEEHVGFGCDFEGMDVTPVGIDSAADMAVIGDALTAKYGSRTAERIMGENVVSVIRQILQ